MVYVSPAKCAELFARMFPEQFGQMRETELLLFISMTQAAEKVASLGDLSGDCWATPGRQSNTNLMADLLGVQGVEPPAMAKPKARRGSRANASIPKPAS